MRQFTRKKLSLLASLLALATVSGGVYYFWKSKTLTNKKSSTPSFNDLSVQLKRHHKTVLKSKTAQLFIDKKWDQIAQDILTPKTELERQKFLEESLHIFDRDSEFLSPEDKKKVFDWVVEFLLEDNKKAKGKKARSQVLAVRLLKRLSTPQDSKALESLLKKPQFSAAVKGLVLEIPTHWAKVPQRFTSIYKSWLTAGNPTYTRTIVGLIPQFRDGKVKVELLSTLQKIYASKLDNSIRPFALKVLLGHTQLISLDPKPLIEASAKQSDLPWIEAFIYGIEQHHLASQYQGQLQKLSQKSLTPSLQKRVQRLMALEGVKQ